METPSQLSESEIRKLIDQTEKETISEINNVLDLILMGVISLSLVKIYLDQKTPSPIFGTASLLMLSKAIDKVIKNGLPGVISVLGSGTAKAWVYGEKLHYASLVGKVPPNVLKSLTYRGIFSHREAAAKAFLNRTTNGMNLSDRVWRLEAGFKVQIEQTLQLAALNGKSAAETAGDLKQYLRNPDMLFRRVRDASGKLQLSKAARQYHPGTGVYRSSYQNAFRLARNEINKAYRAADWQQMQSHDFVTGQRIRLSNNHPVTDICDTLSGLYPKNFKWTGWHVACRCHMLKEIVPMSDFVKMQKGTFTPKQTTDYPEHFHQWLAENKARIKPNSGIDWIEDNAAVIAILAKNK